MDNEQSAKVDRNKRDLDTDSNPDQNDKEPRSFPKRQQGRRYIKTTEDDKKTSFEICGTALSWLLAILTFPFCIFFCFFRVHEFDRAIIFRMGRVRKGARGPGLVWHLPCIDSYRLVDLRTRVEIIPSQDVITKDSVSISVDGVLFYCIQDPMNATIQISNVHESTLFIAQTTLRNILGSMNLHELLVSRQILSEKITIAVDHATDKWGVKVERVELKDINLPDGLTRALASEAEALRDARAKIISAEGELDASKALKEASDVMAENKITLQLRHLQILTSIAQERNVKILYPFPLEFMKPFESDDRKKGGAFAGFGSMFPFFGSNSDNTSHVSHRSKAGGNETQFPNEQFISSLALCPFPHENSSSEDTASISEQIDSAKMQ